MNHDIKDEVAAGLRQWSTELTAALAQAGFGCQWESHTGSSSIRMGRLTVRQNSDVDIKYIIDFERKLIRRGDQRVAICGLEVYNPVGGLHVHVTKFSPETVTKIVGYAKQTIETKIARENDMKARDERQKRGWEIYRANLGDFPVPDWASIRPNIERDADVGTFRLALSDHRTDWPGNRLTLDQAKQVIDFIRSLTCDHKFVDSTRCLKCGWEAPKVVGTHTGHRVPNSGTCEKCNATTNWVVDVSGRLAYWCGCGN